MSVKEKIENLRKELHQHNYNYYVFDRHFFNSTTKGLLSAFVMSVLMIIIGVLKEN